METVKEAKYAHVYTMFAAAHSSYVRRVVVVVGRGRGSRERRS